MVYLRMLVVSDSSGYILSEHRVHIHLQSAQIQRANANQPASALHHFCSTSCLPKHWRFWDNDDLL